jgi:predicted TIM-barrel fold metal-dependent hydrolase
MSVLAGRQVPKGIPQPLAVLGRIGFGKRIMFGSDEMVWPGTIPMVIESIESADFLSEVQKCDIFCRNAVRFLRLDVKSWD